MLAKAVLIGTAVVATLKIFGDFEAKIKEISVKWAFFLGF
jgi:hypothetical protein